MTINQNTSTYSFDRLADINITSTGITNSTNSIRWGDISSASNAPTTFTVSGDADIKGDLNVGGINLMETLKNIEYRLGILRPAPEIESQFEELLELGKKYREMEEDIRSKLQIIKILKES